MALPMPPPMLLGPMNPLETFLSGFNTNTYFIGLMMLLLNLGGRHLAGELTPGQDKIFQNMWIRRGLLFVVIFVATRNIFTAIWMGIGIILILGYLTNETSPLYLFGDPKIVESIPLQGLTTDEQAIYKNLHNKTKRAEPAPVPEKMESFDLSFLNSYQNSMRVVQSI